MEDEQSALLSFTQNLVMYLRIAVTGRGERLIYYPSEIFTHKMSFYEVYRTIQIYKANIVSY